MEDTKIIDLYWARNEQALSETDRKYGQYCRSIALNILKDHRDSDECVSDTYLHAWNAMPPQRPNILSAFLGRITRNLSFDRYKAANAQKRGGGALPAALDELHECIPSASSVEDAMDEKELARTIDAFLRTLPERECNIFLRRYWYADSIRTIAERMRLPENSVKSMLFRTREKLRAVLEKEGIAV
ncbi:MAG: sigma-70 family RNA polymerase sigma factor [Oscillospiraceae bacterium]|nr:sigma-70 family RNA polymerase sigma factor [Oscillospiraceae bacterium]